MQQTFILGRSGDQPFAIDPNLTYVHNQHARIIIDPASQDWILEDLKGQTGNGVYVRNAAGDYVRVYSCRIRPHDMVRLGPENAKSFTFMAHHLISPADYSYEFGYIRNLNKHIQQEEEAHTAMVKKHTTTTMVVPICTALLMASVRLFASIDIGMIVVLSTALGSIPLGLLRYKYRNDADGLKKIKEKRAKLLVCPRCTRTLSDYDVRNCRCSACKAM